MLGGTPGHHSRPGGIAYQVSLSTAWPAGVGGRTRRTVAPPALDVFTDRHATYASGAPKVGDLRGLRGPEPMRSRGRLAPCSPPASAREPPPRWHRAEGRALCAAHGAGRTGEQHRDRRTPRSSTVCWTAIRHAAPLGPPSPCQGESPPWKLPVVVPSKATRAGRHPHHRAPPLRHGGEARLRLKVIAPLIESADEPAASTKPRSAETSTPGFHAADRQRPRVMRGRRRADSPGGSTDRRPGMTENSRTLLERAPPGCCEGCALRERALALASRVRRFSPSIFQLGRSSTPTCGVHEAERAAGQAVGRRCAGAAGVAALVARWHVELRRALRRPTRRPGACHLATSAAT